MIRARYRDGPGREDLLEPGRIYKLTVDLWSVAHTFQAGHIIRLDISSSNFLRYDRNLNAAVSPALDSAEDTQIATHQVFHESAHPSHGTVPAVA
jgi:predicted acyl esterase